jgi:hypothetical protein
MATNSIVLGPYFTSGYITDDYVLDGSLAAIVSLDSTGTTLTLKEGAAALSSQFSLNQSAGFLIDITDEIAYTWDDVYGTWDLWPGSDWEYRGVRLQAFNQVTLNTLNTIFQGATALGAQFSVAVTGTHVRYGEAALASTATMATVAQVTYSGVVATTSAFVLTTTGLRIQEIATTLFDAVALTTTATVTWSGQTAVAAAFSTQTTATVIWYGQSALQAQVTTAIDSRLQINNQDQIIGFRAAFALAQAITLAKTDPYRALVIYPESRLIAVLAEPRTVAIPVNTRIAQVVAETRALEIEQANRVLKLNIPPFKQIVNERQI